MAHGGRALRVGQEIQRMLAELLRSEVKDPRIRALVTITSLDVSPDLRQAKVFVTLMGEDGAGEGTIDALNRCAPFLRSLLSGRMRLRSVPALNFVFDASVGRGARLSRLIDSAVRDVPGDADHEAQRES
jgi:ribosome-binding factor A